jgi:hypothetical protein
LSLKVDSLQYGYKSSFSLNHKLNHYDRRTY